MAFLDDVMIMSFRGVQFAVRLQSTQDWNGWFPRQTIRTVDQILDSEDRYVDIGGINTLPIQRTIAFNTVEERDLFQQMISTIGTITKGGRSRSALYADSEEIESGNSAYSLLNVTFEAV